MNLQELKERIGTAVRVLRDRDGNSVAHAKAELRALGYYDGDPMSAMMAAGLVESVRVFATQGHSGMSAAFARGCLGKLLAFEPLGPLTGAPSEWMEVGPGVFQNLRCSRVFKQADRFDGQAYDIDGIVWRDADGCMFTNGASRVPITFPYTPKTEYRDAPVEVA